MKKIEEEAPREMRWKCVCAFDGTFFKGWQSQAGGGTVQDEIEAALEKIFEREVRIHGCSRTDTGVHARAMVFHFDADWNPEPRQLEAALRTLLPESIRVGPIRRAPPGFHARFSATGKLYRYYIYQGWADPFQVRYCWSMTRPLNLPAMEEAAEALRGRHDFTSFSAFGGREMETPVRDLRTLSVHRTGRRIIVTAEADGFLYKMIRSLVGALVGVGVERLVPEQVGRMLEERRRTHLVVTAPPHGLFLEKVYYRKRGSEGKPGGS